MYLHYVFDLWVEAWRKKVAQGDVIVVWYADDLVVGFESRTDAERLLEGFRERLARFGLELNAEKTRLIRFGRFAAFKGIPALTSVGTAVKANDERWAQNLRQRTCRGGYKKRTLSLLDKSKI